MKFTVQTLIEARACVEQVSLFKELFPDGAEVSEEVATSVATRFDWDWAASNLLSTSGYEAYKEAKAPLWKAFEEANAPLWEAYKEAEAPFLKTYKEAEAPFLKTYKEAEAPLWEAYEEAKAPLWKAFEEAEAPFWKAYKEANAQIFVQLYLKEDLDKDH